MTLPIEPAEPSTAVEPAKPAEVKPDDGSVVVRLVTEHGEADVRVPPRNKWRSIARNRISQGDDLGWAVLTLSREDAEAWMDLDPNLEEVETFFTAYDKVAPTTNRAERRANRNLRAVS